MAWEKAEQNSLNLRNVLERDIGRNLEVIDLSLQAVTEGMRIPAVLEAEPLVRRLVLFDRAANAQDMGIMVIFDEAGRATDTSDGSSVATWSGFAERDYFKVHRDDPHVGLFIGKPVRSRVSGQWILPISRRIDTAEGRFHGVALATLRLTYFSRLFGDLGLGRNGAINLFHRDGTRIMRHPLVEDDIGQSVRGTRNFDQMALERRGSFTGYGVKQAGNRKLYAFSRVGAFPLVLSVSLSADEIEAEWLHRAVVIAAIVGTLCGLIILLTILFGRELERRSAIEFELSELSRTDALTLLPNRRAFDEELAKAIEIARGGEHAVSLLMVDADHFKSINDRYGHGVGDEVLRGLARGLLSAADGHVAFRVGGEEFALLLTGTDPDETLQLAERIHREARSVMVPLAGIGPGTVTVSIGIAAMPPGQATEASLLLRRADEALYRAKTNGRNRTERADGASSRPTRLRPVESSAA